MKPQPIILAGGYGTRLWPLSRKTYPKQFIKSCLGLSSFQQTLIRNQKCGKPIVITGLEHLALVQEQIEEVAIDVELILEPLSKNTAASAIIASLYASKLGHDYVIMIPSDHYIDNDEEYEITINKAIDNIKNFDLCVIGLEPSCSDSAYGYIKTKNTIDHDVFNVEQFVEKPDLLTSFAYNAINNVENIKYFWNCGIFIFKIDSIIKEVKRCNRNLFRSAYNAFINASYNSNRMILYKKQYAQIDSISIDYAIMEHIKNMIMVKGNFIWHDIGSWNSLWKSRNRDMNNNYNEGKVITNIVSNSYIINNEEKLVAVVGLDNIVIINTNDVVLVANKSKSNDINLQELVSLVRSNNKNVL